ncbi:MAG: imidazoleglycerol-phosphate dehydratase HisB [Clostridia bacterium]|nr:imidazoleglycerol-phosphate dehydratase HisB [Clostridia bacterium]
MRTATLERNTTETKINMCLNIDGSGESEIDTGCGFLNHMLTLFAKHGSFDIKVTCKGDTDVDYHHTVEDIGIVLGKLFNEALRDKKGIVRYGSMILPMDEALILSSVDFSGRAYLSFNADIPTEKIGDFDSELVEEFWLGFVRNAACTLHIKQLDGNNSHHIVEGIFKATAKAIKTAIKIDPDNADSLPSTKGVL